MSLKATRSGKALWLMVEAPQLDKLQRSSLSPGASFLVFSRLCLVASRRGRYQGLLWRRGHTSQAGTQRALRVPTFIDSRHMWPLAVFRMEVVTNKRRREFGQARRPESGVRLVQTGGPCLVDSEVWLRDFQQDRFEPWTQMQVYIDPFSLLKISV